MELEQHKYTSLTPGTWIPETGSSCRSWCSSRSSINTHHLEQRLKNKKKAKENCIGIDEGVRNVPEKEIWIGCWIWSPISTNQWGGMSDWLTNPDNEGRGRWRRIRLKERLWFGLLVQRENEEDSKRVLRAWFLQCCLCYWNRMEWCNYIYIYILFIEYTYSFIHSMHADIGMWMVCHGSGSSNINLLNPHWEYVKFVL